MAYNSVNYKLTKLNLITNSGIVSDLLDRFKSIELYESINDTFITGFIVVSDANNFLDSLKLKGDETIELQFSDSPMNYASKSGISESYTFDVYKIENIEYESAHSKTYTVRFISQSYLKNISNRIRKSFEKRGCELTEKIVKDFYNSKLDKITECKYDEHLIFPNVYPSKAIKMICSIATSDTYGSDYSFFETKNGFNFVTTDWLIQQEPVESLNNFLVTTYTEDVQPYKIEDYKTNFKSDVVKNSISGTYGSTTISHNLITKDIVEHSITYDESFDKFTHTGTKKLTDKHNYPKGKMSYIPAYSSGVDTTYSHIEEWYPDNLTRQSQFSNNLISIAINGNDKIKAGDMIFASFSDSGKTSINNPKDNTESGKYLVVNVRKVLTPTKYTMTLDIVGDSNNV